MRRDPTWPFLYRLALMAPGAAALVVAGSASYGNSAATIAREAGEESPGGGATTSASIAGPEAFSYPSHGLAAEGEERFKVGNAIFRKLWVSAPSSTTASDGLGPLHNARSCQSCHLNDGRGHPPAGNFPQERAVSMVLRLSVPPQNDAQRQLLAARRIASVEEPTYGAQLQNDAARGLDNEGHMRIDYSDEGVPLGDGTVVTLRRPTYGVDALKYGPLHAGAMLSARVAPQMIGLGLLEAIPEDVIRAGADPNDADGDGISGRVNEVWSSQLDRVTLGRFGWKAVIPSVREQSANALTLDMGLSNPIDGRASGDCTKAQPTCLNAPNGNTDRDGGLEVGQTAFDHLVFYAQNLAVPSRRGIDDASVRQGKEVFHALGCQGCHRPSFVTGAVNAQPPLSNQTIWPYTDMLLHDMGEGLADHRPEGAADGREWRTAPLWGIGLTQLVSGHTQFLHDGRARNIEESILWHGGEAQRARDGYRALSAKERAALVRFVESL